MIYSYSQHTKSHLQVLYYSRTLSFERTELNSEKSFTVSPGALEKGCSTSTFTQFGRSMQHMDKLGA